MDKHKCKLCLKTFINGRALGGHMRSHMLNLYTSQKEDQLSENNTESTRSENENENEEEDDDKELLNYELRENPKRSIRLVDPEFSFPVDAGSVVVQDSASETESSKNPIRRRSKRIRKSVTSNPQWQFQSQQSKRPTSSSKLSKTESEPVSSISDTTPEENVAFCLMMLSRDKWKREEIDDDDEEFVVEAEKYAYIDADADESYSDSDDNDRGLKIQKSTRVRAKYKCETCNKVFKSYQALGGHRASHKKIKLNQNQNQNQNDLLENENGGNPITVEEKIHECPVCYRVFSSGQALGGHKRSHVIGSSSSTVVPVVDRVKPVPKHGEILIDLDLNLPAPIDDDDYSQIELSAVSDAEFVNPMKR
ncbi:hypothetical protein LguiB_011005 [Lonicera macranthoides]